MSQVTFKNGPVELFGRFIQVGTSAPDFVLINAELSEVSLASLGHKKKIISIVPSLDTGVCQLSTQKINEFAKSNPEITIITVSADLPFAQARFCHDQSIENVLTLSMMRGKEFAKAYGVLMTSGPLAGLAARATLALDEHNRVIYTELVHEIGNEPDYEKLFAAVK